MRCGCPVCGTYMAQSEGLEKGCVCPQCGARCKDCLGTDTVISREALQALKKTDWLTPNFDSEIPAEEEAPADEAHDPSEKR